MTDAQVHAVAGIRELVSQLEIEPRPGIVSAPRMSCSPPSLPSSTRR
jgi:hypothetical protein